MHRIALTSLLLAGAACTSVKPVQPAEYIPQHKPATVWVTYTDNSYVPVDNPTIVGDTLKGTWAGLAEPVTIPFNQIQTVHAKMPNKKKTFMLFGVVGLAAAGVAYTVSTAGNDGKDGCVQRIKGTVLTACCDGLDPGEKPTEAC
jgi:hypothetical protein